MRFWWFFGIALLFCASVSSAERAPNVVGGSDAAISDAPWQAFVVVGNRFCGGVAIASRWVLTAAHCLDGAADNEGFQIVSANSVSVYTGTARINGEDFPSYLSAVEALYVNSTYDKQTFANDIGLIKLAEDIHEHASPIQLADLNVQADVDATANLANNDLQLTGWGFININRTGNTDTLQKAMLSAVSDTACEAAWGTLLSDVTNYQNRYFCAQAPSKGACNGDSGGPLVWYDPSRAGDPDSGARLVGLVSFGIDIQCASPSFPDVYTQVSNYQPWVVSCLAGNCASESSNVIVIAPPTESGGGGAVGISLFLFAMSISARRWFLHKANSNYAECRRSTLDYQG